METTPLQRVIEIKKSQTALADAIGVKQAHIWNWLNRDGGRVPPSKVIAVSRAVSWAVTPHELRPDVYPNATDGLPTEVAS